MIQSALIETLSLLTAGERARFHKYVHSPFFNEGPYARDVTALWEYIDQQPAAQQTIEAAYAAIYPEKNFVKGKIEVLMSKLHQLLKQFVAQLSPDRFETPEAVRLAAFFMDRGLPQRAAPVLEKYREALIGQPVHDADYWLARFETEHEMHRLDTMRHNSHSHERLTEALQCWHNGYLVLTLEMLNNLFFSRRKVKLDESFAERIAEGIPEALQLADLEQEPLLRLLYQGFEFVRRPEKHDVYALVDFHKALEAHAAVLPENLLKALYTYARNHCTWHYNHGDTRYIPLAVSLFKSCWERGFLHENGKIHASTLLNMVQTGLVAGEYEWVRQALEACRDRVTGVPNPEAFLNYNLANYHYHLGAYPRALDLLRDSSDDLFNNLMARKLELKIYYETDSPLLDSKVDNFKLFVFRQGKKNLAENVFAMNNNFIDFLRSLMASGMAGNPAKAAKLLQKLAETPLVAERAWLQTQLEQRSKPAPRRGR